MDLNFKVKPELLNEKGIAINEQSKTIVEAIEEIRTAQSNLASWQSTNKDKFEKMINDLLPEIQEMADVINSYGNVARVTSRAIMNTEKIISNSMNA